MIEIGLVLQYPGVLSQQDQEMLQGVPDPCPWAVAIFVEVGMGMRLTSIDYHSEVKEDESVCY